MWVTILPLQKGYIFLSLPLSNYSLSMTLERTIAKSNWAMGYWSAKCHKKNVAHCVLTYHLSIDFMYWILKSIYCFCSSRVIISKLLFLNTFPELLLELYGKRKGSVHFRETSESQHLPCSISSEHSSFPMRALAGWWSNTVNCAMYYI